MAAGYLIRDVSRLLDLSTSRIRSLVRAGLIAPREGRFSFRDLVLLRAAKELIDARIPSRRVRAALVRLAAQLPEERPLSGVAIVADGDRIVVRDGDAMWNAESGQVIFDFDVAELAKKVAPLARRAAREAREAEAELRAGDWFALGLELETTAPDEARDAYRRALELDPAHGDARVNLGRLLHEAGELDAAEAHYRIVLEAHPEDATAAFNLGVALEDRQRFDEAIRAYEIAIAADPDLTDAYYNLAHLYEHLGRPLLAMRYLRAYKQRTE